MTLVALSDLFRRCLGKETGHWWVGDDLRRTLYLDSGDIVYASSAYPDDKLTSVLVECGKVSRSQMDFALANLKPGLTIGKNLMEMGFITPTDLLEAARLQVGRIVRSAVAAPEAPGFEACGELEKSIVRLPLDTPAMLFDGAMGITDRETLFDALGPLNQVVLLQGKKVFDLELPVGISKLASMMDGTHTILELGGGAGLDTAVVAAFAIFVREMGWAKLFELPPLDRGALDKALTQDLTKPPVSIPSPRPPLFDVIEEAARPTTDLQDLAKELDGLPSHPPPKPPPEPMPEPQSQRVEVPAPLPPTPDPDPDPFDADDPYLDEPTGEVITIDDELSLVLPEQEQQVGRVIIDPEASTKAVPIEPPVVIRGGDEPPDPPRPLKRRRGRRRAVNRLTLLAILAILGGTAVLYAWHSFHSEFKRRLEPPFTLDPEDELHPEGDNKGQAKEAGKDAKPAEAAKAETGGAKPAAPQTAAQQTPPAPPQAQAPQPALTPPAAPAPQTPPAQTPQKEVPKADARPTTPPPDFSAATRLATVSAGNAPRAAEQGKAYKDTLPKTSWTIRLIVAQQGETLQNCARAFGGARPDLFVTPIRMRDGRLCYQLFCGRFANKAAADAEIRKLPDLLQRQSPRPMQVGDISATQ